MPLSRDLVQTVRRIVADNPGISTEILAKEFNVSEVQIITALPLLMRKRGRNSDFRAIWSGMATLPHAIIIGEPDTYTYGSIAGDQRQLSAQFDSMDPDVEFIWFLSKPVGTSDSHAVRFFNRNGHHLSSIYLGRNKRGDFEPAALAKYEGMWTQYGITPVPKMRCTGRACSMCQNCTQQITALSA